MSCHRESLMATVNGEIFAGLNFRVFAVFRSTAKVFRGYTCHPLYILNNEYLWPRQRENISAKTSMVLKPRILSPANLSPSTVYYSKLYSVLKSSTCHINTNILYRECKYVRLPHPFVHEALNFHRQCIILQQAFNIT